MINTIEKFKEKKNRIAVISGEGNLPNQIIKELIHNNIDPIAFFLNILIYLFQKCKNNSF